MLEWLPSSERCMAKVRSATPTRTRRKPRVTASDVLDLLGEEYGPIVWKPRYDAVSELVFTVLSQHTSDVNSERAFNNLLGTFGSLEAVAEADVQKIAEAIWIGGLSRVKAPRIKEILRQVAQERGSLDMSFLKEMPLDEAKAWLKSLPGIGPKSAAVILCFSLGMPAMPVDTHVYRVSKRLGFFGEKTTLGQSHDALEAMVKPQEVFAFHVLLITHGRRVCKAPRPLCHRCELAWGCPSRELFVQEPSRRKRNKS